MFEPIKQWFDTLEQPNHLFNRPEDEAIHVALASVLFHIVNTNHHQESSREYQYFSQILEEEFNLSDVQIKRLHKAAESSNRDLSKDLETINCYLKDNPNVRMQFMDKLIRLIDVDGIEDNRMMTFNRVLGVVFPNININY